MLRIGQTKLDGTRVREADLQAIDRPVIALAGDYPVDWRIGSHAHERAQLVFASQGVMRVSTAPGTWVVPPQRAVWVPPAVEHAIEMHGRVAMRTVYVAPEAAVALPADCCVVQVSELLRALLLRAIDLPVLYDPEGPDGRVMSLILDEIRASPVAPLHLPQGRDPRLRRVTEGLAENPADPRGLAAWARLAGASQRTLARLFEAETGLGFRAWRQQARLLEALTWLAAGRPVTTVALDLGYDSPSAFIAAFKRSLGTTPARYFKDLPEDRR